MGRLTPDAGVIRSDRSAHVGAGHPAAAPAGTILGRGNGGRRQAGARPFSPRRTRRPRPSSDPPRASRGAPTSTRAREHPSTFDVSDDEVITSARPAAITGSSSRRTSRLNTASAGWESARTRPPAPAPALAKVAPARPAPPHRRLHRRAAARNPAAARRPGRPRAPAAEPTAPRRPAAADPGDSVTLVSRRTPPWRRTPSAAAPRSARSPPPEATEPAPWTHAGLRRRPRGRRPPSRPASISPIEAFADHQTTRGCAAPPDQ